MTIAQGSKVLKTDMTNLIEKATTLKTNAQLTSISITGIQSDNKIRATEINSLQTAINSLEQGFSNNCCQSVNTNCQCTQCTNDAQCSDNTQCKDCGQCAGVVQCHQCKDIQCGSSGNCCDCGESGDCGDGGY